MKATEQCPLDGGIDDRGKGTSVDRRGGNRVDRVAGGAVDLSDREAVSLCLGGETAAFEPLVKRYEHRIFVFLYALTSDTELARDLTQDTFVRAWRMLHRFDPNRPLINWLRAIARNLMRDSWRRSRRILCPIEPAVSENILIDPGPAPDAGIEKEDRRRVLGEALALLPMREREVVILKDLEARSYAEIAQILGIPKGTVASRLSSARRTLARYLERLSAPCTITPVDQVR
ncbi:RNA polymerase sigma factor [Gemmatimonadota bacterium]